MRIVFLAVLLLLTDWLAYQAVQGVLQSAHPVAEQIISGVFWVVPVITLAYVTASIRGWTKPWPRNLKVMTTSVIVILYFSKLLMGTVIIIDDIRRVVAWFILQVAPETQVSVARMALMSKFGVLIGIVPLLMLVYGLIRNPYRYKIFRKDIFLPELPDDLEGIRIVQISDIHAGSLLHPDRVARSVSMINDLQPDLVFFTGDLVNTSADEADAIIEVFREVHATHGVYSICGNHDYGDYHRWPSVEAKSANFLKLIAQHQRMGWDLLRNAHRVMRIRGHKVGIIGVENYSAHPRFQKYGDMSIATEGMPETDLTILLSHDPSHWEDEIITRYPWIDLTLSGHTHGFQFGIEIGDKIKWSPVQYVYKQWAGLYRQGDQYLYVNRGLGFLGYPGRVGILPEITLMTLRKDIVK